MTRMPDRDTARAYLKARAAAAEQRATRPARWWVHGLAALAMAFFAYRQTTTGHPIIAAFLGAWALMFIYAAWSRWKETRR
jgi:lipopolysaccharide export LptBFGC system permease protein LptF